MRKIAWWAAVVFAGLGLVTPMVRAADNLLVNPSFEIDKDANGVPDGWKVEWQWASAPNRVVLDSSVHQEGSRSVRVDLLDPSVAPPWGGRMYQDVPVTPGATYQFSGWLKLQGWQAATQKEGLGFRAWEQYDDGSWNDVPFYLSDELFTGDFDWRQFTTTIEIPSNVKTLRIALWSNPGTGTAWWDNLELVRIK
ncbi:MAG: carbohydrate binding domain-containing protein [Limnochordaceae bacterium]|nr:carbohydrate binding domain-containing protein [Limnochordaceae bacterium]